MLNVMKNSKYNSKYFVILFLLLFCFNFNVSAMEKKCNLSCLNYSSSEIKNADDFFIVDLYKDFIISKKFKKKFYEILDDFLNNYFNKYNNNSLKTEFKNFQTKHIFLKENFVEDVFHGFLKFNVNLFLEQFKKEFKTNSNNSEEYIYLNKLKFADGGNLKFRILESHLINLKYFIIVNCKIKDSKIIFSEDFFNKLEFEFKECEKGEFDILNGEIVFNKKFQKKEKEYEIYLAIMKLKFVAFAIKFVDFLNSDILKFKNYFINRLNI